jgi:hypothetical protein
MIFPPESQSDSGGRAAGPRKHLWSFRSADGPAREEQHRACMPAPEDSWARRLRKVDHAMAAIPAVPGALTGAEVVAQVAGTGADFTTIVGFGSLLSATSAASTCPGVRNFRLGRVRGWRRVFAHPAHIFFLRGIAKPETKEIASLCAEPSDDASSGFVMAAFEVPATELPPLVSTANTSLFSPAKRHA